MPGAPGLGGEPAQAGAGRDLLGPPAGHDQHGTAREPVDQVGQHVKGRLVGPVEVVQDQQPRHRAGAGGQQDLADPLEELAAGGRAVQRPRLGQSRVGLDQLGQQPPGLGQPVPRHPLQPPSPRPPDPIGPLSPAAPCAPGPPAARTPRRPSMNGP